MRQCLSYIIALLAMSSSLMPLSGIFADEIQLPTSTQQGISMEIPMRGSTMLHVNEHFGDPQLKKEPVGNPPITVWEYKEYSVYFEQQYVIHSVFNSAGPIIETETDNNNQQMEFEQ